MLYIYYLKKQTLINNLNTHPSIGYWLNESSCFNKWTNCTATEKCVCVCVYDLNKVVLVTSLIAKILEIQMSINRRMDRETGMFIIKYYTAIKE